MYFYWWWWWNPLKFMNTFFTHSYSFYHHPTINLNCIGAQLNFVGKSVKLHYVASLWTKVSIYVFFFGKCGLFCTIMQNIPFMFFQMHLLFPQLWVQYTKILTIHTAWLWQLPQCLPCGPSLYTSSNSASYSGKFKFLSNTKGVAEQESLTWCRFFFFNNCSTPPLPHPS